jgi:hypothetical protein
MADARTGAGSREGVTSRVSSKVGPSGAAGLSKTAVTASPSSVTKPSMLISGPGRYSSMRTPWLALSEIALTTHGNPAVSAARRMALAGAVAGMISNLGWGMPAAAQRCRCRALSAAFRIASTGLCGSPSRAETAAASSSIGASAATTAATGPQRAVTRRAL